MAKETSRQNLMDAHSKVNAARQKIIDDDRLLSGLFSQAGVADIKKVDPVEYASIARWDEERKAKFDKWIVKIDPKKESLYEELKALASDTYRSAEDGDTMLVFNFGELAQNEKKADLGKVQAELGKIAVKLLRDDMKEKMQKAQSDCYDVLTALKKPLGDRIDELQETIVVAGLDALAAETEKMRSELPNKLTDLERGGRRVGS